MRYSGQFWAVPAIVMMAATVQAADRIAPGTEARNAKAAFVYLSQATKDAALKPLDAALIEQRKRADQLGAKLAETRNQLALARKDASASKSRLVELERLAQQAAVEAAEAQEKFTQELAAKDADYARELAVLRTAADEILSTPEGLKYLEANNAGDLAAADAIEEKLIAARQKMRDIQAAADRRAFAVVALDNRNKGLRTTAAVITRYEEVTRLDPGNHEDWITLAVLYTDVSAPEQAMNAARRAEETAQVPAQRVRALLRIAGNLSSHGENQKALSMLDQALKYSAQADAQTGKDSALNLAAHIQVTRGDVLARLRQPALSAYQDAVDRKRMALEAAPTDTSMQYDFAVMLRQLAQRHSTEGNAEAGAASFAQAMDIVDKLIAAEPAVLRYRRFKASLLFQLTWREADPDKAISFANQLIDELAPVAVADGNHAYTLLLLLRAHSLKGDNLEEKGELQEAEESYEVAEKFGDMLQNSDPNDIGAYSWHKSNILSFVYHLYHKSKFQKSLDLCLHGKSLINGIMGQIPEYLKFRELYQLSWLSYYCGLSLYELDRILEAQAEYKFASDLIEAALSQDPNDADFLDLKVDLLMERARTKEPGFSWKRAVDFMMELTSAQPGAVDVAERLEEAKQNAALESEPSV